MEECLLAAGGIVVQACVTVVVVLGAISSKIGKNNSADDNATRIMNDTLCFVQHRLENYYCCCQEITFSI